jgi:hypothetical protein
MIAILPMAAHYTLLARDADDVDDSGCRRRSTIFGALSTDVQSENVTAFESFASSSLSPHAVVRFVLPCFFVAGAGDQPKVEPATPRVRG